jgi:GntR family transcriptional regulator, rspAB operon transcriptional repressor
MPGIESRGNAGYRRFRQAMVGGQIKPGQMLTQSELCEALQMSLSPLRDTLTLLEADGLISVRRRAGITVFTPDVEFIRHNFQFRTLIERDALAPFMDLASLDWLAETRARHEALADRIARREALEGAEAAMRDIDSDFHSAIVDALRNPMISETHRALTENIKLARVLNNEMASPSRLREALAEHLRVRQDRHR